MKTIKEPKVITVQMRICESCLEGVGQECHTPGCALFLHNSPGLPIAREMYRVIVGDGVTCPKCRNYLPGHATGGLDICTCDEL